VADSPVVDPAAAVVKGDPVREVAVVITVCAVVKDKPVVNGAVVNGAVVNGAVVKGEVVKGVKLNVKFAICPPIKSCRKYEDACKGEVRLHSICVCEIDCTTQALPLTVTLSYCESVRVGPKLVPLIKIVSG